MPAWGRLYVIDIMGGPSRLRVFEQVVFDRIPGGSIPGFSSRGEIPLPPISAVGQVVSIGGGDVLFYVSSFLEPPILYRFDASTGSTTRIVTAAPLSSIKFDDAEVVREFATSKDGTRVPLNIIRLKGTKLDGTHSTVLTGYGGYGISRKPFFQGRFARLWLDQGGIFVEANLRGGAEYGEEWHAAGNLTHKQNVFDDFIAAAEYLEKEGYTDKEHLAIRGGSNGGLLMGAALTQRPDLFRAVICQVPLLDMLRYQNFQIAKLWVPEYGSSLDAKQFEWLYAYSPYHRVKEGTAYPAVLFMTADTDTRVDPMHAKKMTALLQADNGGPNPILLRIEPKAGHGAGKPISKQVEEWTDIYSFLFWQLGMTP